MGISQSRYTNTTLKPSQVTTSAWLYENDNQYIPILYEKQQAKMKSGKCIIPHCTENIAVRNLQPYEEEEKEEREEGKEEEDEDEWTGRRSLKKRRSSRNSNSWKTVNDVSKNVCSSYLPSEYNVSYDHFCSFHFHPSNYTKSGLLDSKFLIPNPTKNPFGSRCTCGCNIRRKIIREIPTNVGKWILYYDKQIDAAWEKAVQLFRENRLFGVHNMKCSTAGYDGECSNTYVDNTIYGNMIDCNAIIFYCGNSYDEELIISIGKNISKLLNYKNPNMKYYKVGANMANFRHDIDVDVYRE